MKVAFVTKFVVVLLKFSGCSQRRIHSALEVYFYINCLYNFASYREVPVLK